MPVLRRGQTQRLQHQQLAEGVGQVVFTAQHVGNAHERIVHGVGKKERRAAIATRNDEIADLGGGALLQTAHEVGEGDAAGFRYPEPQRGLAARSDVGRALLGGKVPAGAEVPRRAPSFQLPLAADRQLHLRAIAFIHVPGFTQAHHEVRVEGRALRLPVWPGCQRGGFGGNRGGCARRTTALAVRPRVPAKAEPLQVGEARLGEFGRGAGGVRVFQPEHETASGLPGQQPVEEGRAGVPQVETPGRAGCETSG